MHALVLKGGAADNRDKPVGNRLAADRRFQVLLRDGLLLEKHHPQFLIKITHLGNEVGISLLRRLFELGRDLLDFIRRAHNVVVQINDGLVIDDVDLAFEVILFAQRNQHWPRVGSEFCAHALHGSFEVGTGAVHLVDERDTRHPVFRRLSPHRLGLRLNSRHPAEYGNGTVQDTE